MDQKAWDLLIADIREIKEGIRAINGRVRKAEIKAAVATWGLGLLTIIVTGLAIWKNIF